MEIGSSATPQRPIPRTRFLLIRCFAAIFLATFSLFGCAPVNKPLNSLKLPLELREKNRTRASIGAELISQEMRDSKSIEPATRPTARLDSSATAPMDADGCFVGVAISGGGSRSANFAAAAMFQLQRLGILQRVDYISAVSGGSITAAYYCTQDENWNPETVQKKLTQSFANDVLCQTLMPWNIFALMFTSVDRTDLLADTFQRTLFSRGGKAMTYADLRADRPRLLINATDLQSGKRFVFSNEAFDEINSDLAAFPISRAVAASSAVPILLHQLTLEDHSTTFDQYRHLIDGGVSDNLGAQTLVETFAAHIEQAKARGEPDPYPKGAVMLFLDATVGFDARLSDRRDTSFLESLTAGMGLSTTSLLRRAGSATLADLIVQNAPNNASAEELRGFIKTLRDEGHLTLQDRTNHTVRVAHISLTQVDMLSNVPFMSFRESVNNIATYFNIDRTEAYRLYQAADLIVKQKHESTLIEFLEAIDGKGPPTTQESH